MANKTLFRTIIGKLFPATNATNSEGAPAYAFDAKHALAQYAVTGCLNGTFYATATDQLERVLDLATKVDGEFIAKTAIYSRQKAYMKDMPALLTAILAGWDPKLLKAAFGRTIDNAKMLRNFVQIIRSGATGRKSLGSAPKRLVREWLEKQSDSALFDASVGQSPSLADIVKMVHPKPATAERRAFFGYLLDREHDAALLPEKVRAFEAFRKDTSLDVPDVPFQLLTNLNLSASAWRRIAERSPWHATRMNLNTFVRHGVFDDSKDGRRVADIVASRLADRQLVKKARAFPHQLLATWAAASSEVPAVIKNALQDAMEIAVENVPQIDGPIHIFPDVSGSMHSPATGHRKGATSAIRCIDIAALVAAAFARRNPRATIVPFEHHVVDLAINPRDSVMTNATKLAKVGGGGTNISAPLARLNQQRAEGNLVVYVSDNESWVDARAGRGTELMTQWGIYKARNPEARLVAIDIQPNSTTQATERQDILNIGGFSDQVFEVIAQFAKGELAAGHWVAEIERISLTEN